MSQAESETPSSAATPVATGLRDGVALAVAKFGAALLAFVAQGALLRVTSEQDFGRYSTFIIVSNLAIAFTVWPCSSVLRLGSNEWVKTHRLARTYWLHLLLVLGAAAILATPLWEARDVVDRYVTVPGATKIVLAYALITAVATVSGAILKPAGKVLSFAILPVLSRIFYVGAFGWLALQRRTLDAREMMLICVATAIPQLVAAIFLAARHVLPPARLDAEEANVALRFGLPVLFRMLGGQSFAYVNAIYIKRAEGLVAMSRISIASNLAEQTALLAGAFEDLVGPILARSAAEGKERVLRTYYALVAPQVALAWSTACGVAILLAFTILQLLRAKSLEASGITFQILLLATTVRIVVSLESPVFDAHLISAPPLAFFALGFATNLGLDVVLVPRFGIQGAAWASVAGWTVNALLRSGYLGWRFRVPSPLVFLYLLPAGAAFVYARTLGGRLVVDLGAAAALVAGSLLVGRLTRVFSPAAFHALEGVRMPQKVRRLLAWFYGAPPDGAQA